MFFMMRNPLIVAAIALLFLLLSVHLGIEFSFGGSFSIKSTSSTVKSPPSSSSRNYHPNSTRFIHNPYSSFSKTENSPYRYCFSLSGVGVFSILDFVYHLGQGVSFLIVQVGLSGKDDTVRRELNEISNTINTSSLQGQHHILTETVSVLLNHSDSFISGHASVKRLGENAGIERPLIPQSTKPLKDYIVVSILIAARGTYELPTIRSIDDMKAALTSLNIGSGKLMAVEVLWTPQDENDTLSEEELLENYPLLRPI